MPRRFEISELLADAAPGALCETCIRDRVPLSARGNLGAILADLKAPYVERLTGECAACLKATEVIRGL
jgi:hypothetical protein